MGRDVQLASDVRAHDAVVAKRREHLREDLGGLALDPREVRRLGSRAV